MGDRKGEKMKRQGGGKGIGRKISTKQEEEE